ncbi:hypothetical protein [Streptomyces sp. NPDC088707]|uniref:hypothetical protein n=1 Tax=Streptomyces sp. NPDC088707 TaxID=3365871 RepID=UPI003806C65A
MPMTAATTAISATAETTRRVRSDHGPRAPDDEVGDDRGGDDRVGDDQIRDDRAGDDAVREDPVRDDRVRDDRVRCPAPLTTSRYSPGLMR